MFKPKHGLISNEDCIDSSGWTTDTGQLLDGTLRLSPITTRYERTDTSMVEKTWDLEWDFENGDYTGWSLFGNYTVDDGKLRIRAMRDYATDTTDAWNVSYGGATLLSTAQGFGTVDNTLGWSCEMSVACEGLARFTFYDGTKRFSGFMGERSGYRGIWLIPPGESLSQSTGEFVFPLENFGNIVALSWKRSDPNGAPIFSTPVTQRQYKDIRFSVKGGDLTIDSGSSSAHFPSTKYLQNSAVQKGHYWQMEASDQKFGVYRYDWSGRVYQSGMLLTLNSYLDPIGNSLTGLSGADIFYGRGDLWFERYRVSASEYQPVWNISKWATVTYTTNSQTAYSPAFIPDPGVTRFQNAIYTVENATGDGTLYVTPQYRYAAGSWLDGTQVQLTGDHTQKLTSFQPVGDGEDSVRFKVVQASSSGTGAPPRLDNIAVTVSRYDQGVYKHSPSWGPRQGANTVAFDIVRSPSGFYYGTGDVFILAHDNASVSDESPNTFTVTEEGTVGKHAQYVNLLSNMEDVTTPPWAGSILATSTNPGDGLTVNGLTSEVVQRRHPKTTELIYMQHITGNSVTEYVRIDSMGTFEVGKTYIVEFALWVNRGIVNVSVPSTAYASGLFVEGEARLVRIAFEATNVAQALHFLCHATGTDFYVGGFRCYKADHGHLNLGVVSEINNLTRFNIHAKTYLHAYPTNTTAIIGNKVEASGGWTMGLDPTGRTVFSMGGNTITGDTIVPLNQWSTITARVEPDYVEVLHDGESSIIYQPTFSTSTGETFIGNSFLDTLPHIYPGALAEVRISQEEWTAYDLSYNYVRTTVPTFKCALEPELDSDTLVYLTFNQSRGIIHNQGSLDNVIIPWNSRRFVYRGITGSIAQGIRIYNDDFTFGRMRIPLFDQTWLNESFAIEADVLWSAGANHQTLISVGGWGDIGFQVRATPAGYLQYHYTDDVGSREVTSDTLIAGTEYKHLTIVHNRTDNSVLMKINGTQVGTLAADTVGDMDASQSNIHIGTMEATGEPVWVQLDNLKIQGDVTGEYSEAYPWNIEHWTPSETVYVDGDALHSDRVSHISPYRKLVVMPAHTPGSVSTRVIGSEFLPISPYNYIYNYDIEIDTGEYEARFGSTRSPFRIMGTPPEHSVKIAMIGTTPLSVDTHMSITDLSDHEPSNRTGYGVPTNALRGSPDHEYLDSVDTDEILVSNRSAMWQTLIAPKPMFFKYLLGRAKFYVYAPTAQTAEDIDPIRKAIKLSYINNEPVQLVWDVEVSSKDYYDETLPPYVYSVVLLLEGIPNQTLWATYPGVSFRNLSGHSDHRTEIVNPVPLFGIHSGRMGVTTTINELGSYDVEVET